MGRFVPITTAHRKGLGMILATGGEHELSRKLREAGGDDLFVAGMIADLGAKGFCPLCKRVNNPSMWRLYANIRKAVGESHMLAERLAEALEMARPAREAVENASSMSNDERRAAIISWLARDQGVPEAAMRVAVFNVRSQAVVVEHSHETNGNGNGNGKENER